MPGSYFYFVKYRAERDGIEFDVTPEEVWALFLKQRRRCPITGLKLKFAKRQKDKTRHQNASLDRIDSSLGYVRGNLQWIHKVIQPMKMSHTTRRFYRLVKVIHDHRQMELRRRLRTKFSNRPRRKPRAMGLIAA